MLQRLQAEFDNFKKRLEKDKEDFTKYANHKLIYDILTVLDSFDLALKNVNDDELGDGIKMVYEQLFSTLEKKGLRLIESVGRKLDPNMHEVMMKVNGDEEDVILEELQKGYMLNDKVLRYAKVKVSKKSDNKDKSSNQEEKND